MCEPTTIALVGLSVASSVTSLVGQQSQANAQADALGKQRKAQAEEQAAQAEENLGQRVREGRRARARMRVAAGEAGISGNSFEAQISNSLFQQDQDSALIAKNLAFADRASQARTESAFASLDTSTPLSAGLQIANAGASGYLQGAAVADARKSLSVAGAT